MANPRHPRRSAGPSQRQLRVGELIRHALAEVFTRGEVRDPALAGATVTISEVTVTPDLRHARAFIVPLGGGQQDEVLAGLGRSAKFLRGRLARMIDLKHVPELVFELDTSFEYSDHVRGILASDEVARDLDRDGEE